ncbi:hypothetical protein LCGC14_2327360 [marine sediment metagenome]|uniref:Uncharacterized protein n=1 Tax=marine sediment metagenome TaxID=412755 RepID=A0A0F9CG13_9ZZZZ
MIERMDTPGTRAEFERRFHLLREQIESGKLRFAHGMKMSEVGLREVQYLPNGRLDLLSINEFARLHANMAAQMEDMQGRIPQGPNTGSDVDCNETKPANNKKESKRKRKATPKTIKDGQKKTRTPKKKRKKK